MSYNPNEIEKKWQEKWQAEGAFEPDENQERAKNIS